MNKDNIITVLVSVVASVAFSVALASTVAHKSSVAGNSQDVNQAIEDYLMNNPSKVREALELAAQQEQLAAQKRIAENYKNNWKDLSSADNSPFVGPKDAKITIVEFFDFNCGYCKRLAPELMKVIKANKDVKFVFKPVTFLGSIQTAKAALAANKQGKFIEVYEAFLTHNGQINAQVIDEVLEKAGLDVAETKKIMESDEIKKALADISELSRKVEVRGVPTLIINGEALQAIEQGPIQNAIDNRK
ncbi:DsbA family protein [bacterium]|nr:DsbA family protein [bacterium]MBR2273625.1 DsbA family protein [Alphaproteobacteria bacterium]